MKVVHKNIHGEIITQCLKGSRSAQYELYKLYSKAMYNISYRMINDTDEAEDVLQEAFIAAFNNLKSYKGSASFGAWLKRIVVNKAINHINSKHNNLIPLDEIGSDIREDSIIQDDNLELEVSMIKRAINFLSDGYRIVFSLYLLEGYDHKEIASILNITESTSKSQYNRAKNRIREILKTENFRNGIAG